MRALRLTVALALLAPVAGAQEVGPRLVVREREVPLGDVLEGAVVERTIDLESRGDAPLVVTRVEASCGCAVIAAPTLPIAPGAAAPLRVRFDSTGRRGPQRVTLWVYSNDPTARDRGDGCTALSLVGEVRSLFTLSPEGAFLGEVVRGDAPAVADVTITPAPVAAARFAPRLASTAPEGVEVELERVQGAARLRVRLRPDAAVGELLQRVVVETGVSEQPRVVVPVVAIVSSRVSGPRAVELFGVERRHGATRRAPLERRDGRAGIDVLEVSTPAPWLRARVEPVSPTRADLVVELLPDAPPGPFASVVEVLLDEPDDPLVRVPVVGEVLPRVTVDPGAALLAPGEEVVMLVRGARPREARVRGGEGLSATIEPPAAGERARARLVVRAAPTWDGAPALVIVVTEVEGEERLTLPVRRRP